MQQVAGASVQGLWGWVSFFGGGGGGDGGGDDNHGYPPGYGSPPVFDGSPDVWGGNSPDGDNGGGGDNGSGGGYGGADPSAGGSRDSPNPADQGHGYGHMGPPGGAASGDGGGGGNDSGSQGNTPAAPTVSAEVKYERRDKKTVTGEFEWSPNRQEVAIGVNFKKGGKGAEAKLSYSNESEDLDGDGTRQTTRTTFGARGGYGAVGGHASVLTEFTNVELSRGEVTIGASVDSGVV